MKATEKNIQKLSYSYTREGHSKSKSKRWKVNMSTIEDYLDYMEENSLEK